MTSHFDKNDEQISDLVDYDPVGQLKVSVNKLTIAVRKMGDVLGAVDPGDTNTLLNESKGEVEIQDSLTRDIDELEAHKNYCQDYSNGKGINKFSSTKVPSVNLDKQQKSLDEIKAQRANKAAAKKARAERSAAAKSSIENSNNPQAKNKKDMKPQKDTAALAELSEKSRRINKSDQNEFQQTTSAAKSVWPTNGKCQAVREVKFDLSNNAIMTASEESIGSNVPVGPCSDTPAPPSTAHIHPAFLNLAVHCEQGIIDEVDSLCLNFIMAFKEFLSDWTSQHEKENRDQSSLGHDLDASIRPQIAYLTQEGRYPLPCALGNIVRQLKKEVVNLGALDRSGRAQAIEDVSKWLVDVEEENFGSAYHAISDYLLGKMKTSPNVITYSWCPLVNKVLLDSIDKKFQAFFTVVDAEIGERGLRHINSFIERGIRCRYTDLNSIGAVMKKLSENQIRFEHDLSVKDSMVILGCSAVLSNGCVIAPKGSMLLALAAKAFNIPVLVVSQTYKFVDKVQSSGRMALLGKQSNETVPSDLVTAIVTDIRVLPPSSAPAVLKAKALDLE